MAVAALLSLPLAVTAGPPMTTGDAFTAGKSYTGAVDPGAAAKTGGGSVTFGGKTYGIGDVMDMNAAQGATGALDKPPEAALGGGGTLDPTSALGASEAGSHVTTTFGTRPVFTIDPATDPMMTKSQTIENDPEAVAGAITGTYSGCSSITSSTPPVYEEKICHESVTMAPQACQKILNVAVKVDWVPSCASGTVIATSAAGQSCDKHDGADDWHGYHASAVCDYSSAGRQKIVHRRDPIDEGQLGASGCGAGLAPNLSLMTAPAFWVPEAPTAIPQPLYSYIDFIGFGSSTRHVYYAGGCTGDSCSYTIMDQGQFDYTYPACPSGTTAAESLYIMTASSGGGAPTYAPLPPPGGCFAAQPTSGFGCAAGDISAYTKSGSGFFATYTPVGCQRLQITNAPTGYTVTGDANTLNFARARLVKKVTETDAWDNQCAGLEAQAK